MSIGLMVFLFVVGLILVSISPLDKWRLPLENPLDVDDLQWPVAGFGSATISLNCLFGAYAAMLLLIGYVCFAGIVVGVVGGLFMIYFWVSRHQASADKPGFQALLYGLKVFESPAADRAFWLLVALCQLGLAIAELVLLHHVFSVGLGFSEAHATVASLSAACVAYYYSLFGGYQAAFRADALQYVFILIMGAIILLLLWRDAPGGIGTIMTAVRTGPSPAKVLMVKHPYLRVTFEIFSGLALGMMPVLAAPDAWKRVVTINLKYQSSLQGLSGSKAIFSALRLAPIRLLAAVALPLGLILPPLARFSGHGTQGVGSFPIGALFLLSPPIGDGFILLGMLAAFMSTFDSALLSATHVLMGQKLLPDWAYNSGRARFRIIFGLSFTCTFLMLVPLISWLPSPYAPGALLVAPFATVSGLLVGTSFGARRARSAMLYILSPTIVGWVFFALQYLASPSSRADPYAAAYLVLFGCCVFFLVASSSRVLSRKIPR